MARLHGKEMKEKLYCINDEATKIGWVTLSTEVTSRPLYNNGGFNNRNIKEFCSLTVYRALLNPE